MFQRVAVGKWKEMAIEKTFPIKRAFFSTTETFSTLVPFLYKADMMCALL